MEQGRGGEVGHGRAGHQHSQAIQLFSNNDFTCDCHCVCLLRRRCLVSYFLKDRW